MKCVATSISLVLALSALVDAKLFPNEIVGSPTVQCSEGSFTIDFQTADTNASRVFAKGFHEQDGCYFMNTNKATFSLSNCNMNRKRQIQPRGVSYELTVVVQMHPMFITQVDRAYHVRCFYMEADKLVTAGFNVDQLTTSVIEQGSEMPTCSYSLHKDSPNGPAIRYTQVGDQIFHVWQCPSDAYSMLVHSCYVSDNQGAQILVLDENGCGIDDYVLGTPMYNTELTRAQIQSNVFKFADKITVAFQCQIKLCLRGGDLCDGLTPPRCAGTTAAPLPTSDGNVQTLPGDRVTSRPSENLLSSEDLGVNEAQKPTTQVPITSTLADQVPTSTGAFERPAQLLDVEKTTSSDLLSTSSTIAAMMAEAIAKLSTTTTEPSTSSESTRLITAPEPSLAVLKTNRLQEELGSDELMAITQAVTMNSPSLPQLTTTSKRFNGTLIKLTIPVDKEESTTTPSTQTDEPDVEGSGENGVIDGEPDVPLQVLGVPKDGPGLFESPDLSDRHFGRRLADLPVIETDVKTHEVVVLDGDAQLRAEFDSPQSDSAERIESLRSEYAAAVSRLQEAASRDAGTSANTNHICLSTIGFGFMLFAFILATICSVTIAVLYIRHSPAKRRQRLIDMTRWQQVSPSFS